MSLALLSFAATSFQLNGELLQTCLELANSWPSRLRTPALRIRGRVRVCIGSLSTCQCHVVQPLSQTCGAVGITELCAANTSAALSTYI